MTTRTITQPWQIEELAKLLRARKLPVTVKITAGKLRTNDQNHLQRMWCGEIAEQLGDRTPEEVRGYCKLCFGVPILRAEDEVFAASYDEKIKPLPYETKLACMMEPLDMPITRRMTTKQKTRYLDDIHAHFAKLGVVLTMPVAA